MKCEDLLEYLNDYVDGDIDPEICDEFKEHIAHCNPCEVVIDNIRKTITLYKSGEPCEIPLKFKKCLHKTLKEKWDELNNKER